MAEKENQVGATHDFHDEDYARSWSNRFNLTLPRKECFATMAKLIDEEFKGSDLTILELGSGPGYLAAHLLSRFKDLQYICLDFSKPMLKLASNNLKRFSSRVSFQRQDLTDPDWSFEFGGLDAVVSNWTLHDLQSPDLTADVYKEVKKILRPGGLFLNSDFIHPEGCSWEFEPGRFSIEKHIELLKDAGFYTAKCTKVFEPELENPQSHQNYGCFKAS